MTSNSTDGEPTGNAPALVQGEYVRRKPLHELFAKAAGDTDAASNTMSYEDEFTGKYGATLAQGVTIIAPPFLPRQLEALVMNNNALMACIDAMVTNVHETGFIIEPKKVEDGGEDAEEDKDDPERQRIIDFFDEVWPGIPFVKLRKEVGTDEEKTGMGYIEVIRNLKREMLMLRRMDPKLTRLVVLSKPYDAEISIRRGETTVKATVPMRYRRYVQTSGAKFVFFKEYGCPLEIDKHTGELYEEKERIRLIREKKLGSEVIQFGKVPDVETPYFVPAWIPQMPSVLGSRKAEEYNLDYFDSGGVPPLMVFVHGGALVPAAKTALEEFLNSKPGAKQGAPVFEAQATGGSLEGGASSVRVTVERFGSERQKDSMFEVYDKTCEQRIRRSWRLPPIFVGMAQDYSFATAHASYSVGEAQVFKPERDEFDTIINTTIMRELDPTGKYVFRSLGVPVKDVTNQLAGLAKAEPHIKPSDIVKTVNEITALNLKPRDGIDEQHQEAKDLEHEGKQVALDQQKNPPAPVAGATNVGAAAGKKAPPKGKPATSKKSDVELSLELADEVFEAVQTGGQSRRLFDLMTEVAKLDPEQVDSFRTALTDKVYEGAVDEDSEVARYTSAALLMAVMR